jgi:hypothetical protein
MAEQAGNLWPYAFCCLITAADIALGLWWLATERVKYRR